jgi:molybdopterin synthase sulfur carrier subunit
MANGDAIEVLYFGRIAELTGMHQERLAWPVPQAGTALLEQVRARHPALTHATRLRLAVNQAHARWDRVIAAGDEVAVFEPVTGG